MKRFLVLTLAALTNARPEAGYPSSSYGVPLAGGGSFGGGVSGGHGGGLAGGSGGHIDEGSGFGGGYNGGSLIVQKHFYVHVPPPEPEVVQPPKIIVPSGPPRKNYKIVFIKAPTPPTPTAPIIAPIAQDEEKTLIYVLAKRPEEGQPIVIPTAAPTQPSKPEVYFIRYRALKETQAVGGGIGGEIGIGVQDGIGAGIIGGVGGKGTGDDKGSIGPSTSYGVPSGSGPY